MYHGEDMIRLSVEMVIRIRVKMKFLDGSIIEEGRVSSFRRSTETIKTTKNINMITSLYAINQ